DMLFVELSPYGYRFRRKHRRRLQKRLKLNLKQAAKQCSISYSRAWNHYEIKRVRGQLALPFEYRAAVKYAQTTNTAVALVDSSSFSRRWIAFWAELISTDNLQTLLSLPAQHTPAHHLYQLAKRGVAGKVSPTGLPLLAGDREEEGIWAERERYMAQQIRRAINTRTLKRALFIGGWWHLTTGNGIPTIRDLLALDASQCLVL
ncbi:MAG: hypothetical protein RBS57_16805, partial [Desulforhabdus sp.]|nr:hypothetical protein [Desulforhabdus sp.]